MCGIGARWRSYKQGAQQRDEARAKAAEEEERRRVHEPPAAAASSDASSARARGASDESAWDAFVARHADGDGTIRMADVPWPKLDAASLGLDARYTSLAQRKKAFRASSLRWHPDKFVQSFGAQLAPSEREAVLQRVTEVSQTINQHFQAAGK